MARLTIWPLSADTGASVAISPSVSASRSKCGAQMFDYQSFTAYACSPKYAGISGKLLRDRWLRAMDLFLRALNGIT